MIELEDALKRILAVIPPARPERVGLDEAHGRVLLERILSPSDLPGFDNSAMDGYAVRSSDVLAVRPEKPVRLRIRGKIPAGSEFTGRIAVGECVRLFTGSPLPAGADAVVIQEDTRADAEHPDEILVMDSAKPFENVRPRGSDVKQDEIIAEAGEPLTSGKISLLGALGIGQVPAGKRPSVGLLATGSELREAGQPLAPGQIYESNRFTLAALVRQAGALPRTFPLVQDDLAETRKALETAFNDCDVVVTSGGVSVGEMDFVKAAFEGIGGHLEFWKVAIRPGRPFVFGRLGEKFLFGLPGNPVSAFVTFLLLARPALLRWQGALEVGLPTQPGKLVEPLTNPGGRRHFVRVRIDTTGNVRSAGVQASHALLSLAVADGFVDMSPGLTLKAGETVTVMRWDQAAPCAT